jgi:hypothetical protein
MEEKDRMVAELLSNDFLCRLPCWGGIEPGRTSWMDAKSFLSLISQIHSSSANISTAEIQVQGENLVLRFYTKAGKVEFMAVPRFEYPITRLLIDYGAPDEIYFHILDVLPMDKTNPYTIFLFYKERGIIAEYSGVSDRGETISICLNSHEMQTGFLSLWTKGSDKEFVDVINKYMDNFSEYSALDYYNLEDLTTLTSNAFVEKALGEPGENCLLIQNPNSIP